MMYPFRKNIPTHRKNRKICKHYKSYKQTLKIDFNKRCGYCNDLDTNRIRNFVIDHFVPQTPYGWSHSILPNEYLNLIYACPFCNGAKSNKWPTKDETKPNDGSIGFIKPTTKHYSKVFRRGKDGSILVYKNHLVGEYMHKELGLGLDIHSLNWKFEKIFEQEKKLESLVKKTINPALKVELTRIRLLRLEIVDEIYRLYND